MPQGLTLWAPKLLRASEKEPQTLQGQPHGGSKPCRAPKPLRVSQKVPQTPQGLQNPQGQPRRASKPPESPKYQGQ